MDHIDGVFESLAVPFNAIAEGLDAIFGVIQQIGWMLNPFHESFILKVAFVPSEDYELNMWNEVKAAVELKIPLVFQVMDFMETIGQVATGAEKPAFTVTFNGKYGHGTYQIIDFSYFDDYRLYILNFIRYIAWFFFIKKVYKQLPHIVY